MSRPAAPPPFPPLDPEAPIDRVAAPAARSIGELARQLPAPSELAAGSFLAVTALLPDAGGTLTRLLGRRRATVPLSVRCTALLVAGYTDVCAAPDGTAFGRAPTR